MTAPLPRFHEYEIAEDPAGASLELSRSGHEVVCLASLPDRQRWVELHVLTTIDTLDPSSRPVVEAFRARVQSLRRAADRQLPEVLEAGEDEGALFYVSEFIDGEPLDAYFDRCAPVPPWWAMVIARQLTGGLLALRDTPDLLACARVAEARLSLEGESTEDAMVTLTAFDLGAPPEKLSTPAAAAEAHAMTEIGRLLGRALGVPGVEQMTAAERAALPLPEEITSVLDGLLAPSGRRAPTDLGRLRHLLTALAQSPALATAPPRLPPALRPHLPLAAHFPGLPRLATELGSRLRLERTPFDAAHPYAQRAFEGTEAVTVQLLPPRRLLSPDYLPAIRRAADLASARPSPHLLRVLEVPVRDDAGWFLEEGAPRLSLERARRLRRHFSAAEAAFLLQLCDQAVLSIEARGLPPAAVSPAELFLEFDAAPDATPGDDLLAARPVHEWPPFKIRMRAHPTTVHLAQPRRFCRDRLLDPAPPRLPTDPPPGPPDGLGSPTAADYAALFAWMNGGLSAVPRGLAVFLSATLHQPAATARSAVVDAVLPFLPRPTAPTASTSSALSSAPPTSAPPASPPRRHSPPSAQLPAAPKTGAFRPVADAPAVPAAAPAARTEATFSRESTAEPAGFAEVLLGPSLLEPAPEPTSWLTPVPEDDADEAAPVGTLFGHPADPDAAIGNPIEARAPALRFRPRTEGRHDGPARWRLVMLVIIISLLIAILMAHVTGLGFWR